MRWRISLPDDRPPLNLNQRQHWAAKGTTTRRLRALAARQAKLQGIPHLDHLHTRLVWIPPDRRRRDEDNIVATAKPLWDGLVDAGVVDDDTSVYMTKYMPRIAAPDKHAETRVYLQIWTEDND